MQVARHMGIQLHDSHFLMDAPITDFGKFKASPSNPFSFVTQPISKKTKKSLERGEEQTTSKNRLPL
jgi:hypothetical protein